MAHHQKQKRKFPVQGIGRGGGAGGLQGHASLPPKPGIPGKPLPRDTGPIVLTGGKDNVPGSFSYSHVTKRAYSSAAAKAESPTTTRREPVMTALAPASQLRAATSPAHHHKLPVAATITPPAEMMTRPFSGQVTSLMSYGPEFNDVGTGSENQISPQQNGGDSEALFGNDLAVNNSRVEPVYSNNLRPEMTSQPPSFLSFPHPNFYENGHESSFHPNRNFTHHNGHEAQVPTGPASDGYLPYLLPHPPPSHSHSHPHYMHPQHQHQNQYHQGFIHHGPQDPYSFPDSMTPPNTGALFAPPPLFQPHGAVDDSNKTSEIGGSTNPQTPFTPPHSFPAHLDLQHPHPQHSVFPPPPSHMAQFDNFHQEQHRQQQSQMFEGTMEVSLDKKPEHLGVIESNPRLHSISFFPTDSDRLRNETAGEYPTLHSPLANSAKKMDHHDQIPNNNEKAHPEEFGSRADTSQDLANEAAAHRLQAYCLGYFLSDKLADVNLFVKQIGESFEWDSEQFNAHSFILGRSMKLAYLIEDAIKGNDGQGLAKTEASEAAGRLSRSSSRISWADEVENEQKENEHLLPITETTPGRKVTVLLETSDKYLSRYSFLLALRWLYGGEYWELDAYLDPSHPKHRTLEWTRENAEKEKNFGRGLADELVTTLQHNSHHKTTDNPIEPNSLESGANETKSEEVRMLERSFALLAAGTLLGIDEIIDKGAWGVRRWGMRFEGGAFERLLEFALEGCEGVDPNEALSNGVCGSNTRYGIFTKHLLGEAIAFLVKNLPNPFKFDPKAPASKYLVRIPESPHQSSTNLPTQIIPIDRDSNRPEKLRKAYSTILLSVPFSLLRTILEHDGFATRNGDWKGIARYDIAKAVVHERERRRKYSFKVVRERRVSTCSEMTEIGAVDEHSSDLNVASVPPCEPKEAPELENLFWEESVLCTFGHGGNGLEITRRRKGGSNGGRVLWKVGSIPVKI